MADELEGWDPRVEDYHDHHSNTVAARGPLASYSRLSNLARTQDSVREPRGLYVKNVPRSMTSENLKCMFSEHGNVLSVFVGQPNPEHAAANITWAIVKVASMRDSLSMITALHNKPPLNLKVELSMTEEEKRLRKFEKEERKRLSTEMANLKLSGHHSSSFLTNGSGLSQDREVSKLEESSVRKPQVVEVGCGSVMVQYRKPLPCVHCLLPGEVRCSVCKAWYCGKLCQVDDWYYHKGNCSPPPDVENPDVDILKEVGTHKSGGMLSITNASGVMLHNKTEVIKRKYEVQNVKDIISTESKNMSPESNVTGAQRMVSRKSPSSTHRAQLRRPHHTEGKSVGDTSFVSVPVVAREISFTSKIEPKEPIVSKQLPPIHTRKDNTDSKPAVMEQVPPIHAKKDNTDNKPAVTEQVPPVQTKKDTNIKPALTEQVHTKKDNTNIKPALTEQIPPVHTQKDDTNIKPALIEQIPPVHTQKGDTNIKPALIEQIPPVHTQKDDTNIKPALIEQIPPVHTQKGDTNIKPALIEQIPPVHIQKDDTNIKPALIEQVPPVHIQKDDTNIKPALIEQVPPVHIQKDNTDSKLAVFEQVPPVHTIIGGTESKPNQILKSAGECYNPPEVESSGGIKLNDIPKIKTCDNGVQEDNAPEENSLMVSLSGNGKASLNFQNLPTLSDSLKLECDYIGVITVAESFKDFTAAVFVEGCEEILSGADSFLSSIPPDTEFRPQIGSLVAALSPQDESWYRAFVYSVDACSYYVCYIDFGNLERVSSVKPLPLGKYQEMPGYAMLAQMQSEATLEVQNVLQDIIQEGGQVAFTVIGKKSGLVKAALTVEGLSNDVVEYILKPWYMALPSLENKDLGLSLVSESSTPKIEAEAPHLVPSPICKTAVDTEFFEKGSGLITLNTIENVSTTDGLTPALFSSPDRRFAESSNDSHSAPVTPNIDTELPIQGEMMKASLEETQQSHVFATESSKDPLRHDTVEDTNPAAEHLTPRKFWACDLGKTEVDIGREYSVMPVWVDRDNNLFVHVLTDEFLTKYQELACLTNNCRQGNVVGDVEVGEVVCGYIAYDDLWYRAEVLEKHPKLVSLFFVDFGDTQYVPRTDIREFSAGLMAFPRFCVKVQVLGMRKDDEVAQRKLNGFVSSQTRLTMVSHGDMGVLLYNQDKVLLNNQIVSSEKEIPRHHDPKESSVREDLQTNANSTHQLPGSPVQEGVKMSSPSPLPSPQLGAVPKSYTKCSAPDNCSITGDGKEKVNMEGGMPTRMYQDCQTSTLALEQTVDVFVLESVNPHTIFVISQDSVHLYEKLEELSVRFNKYCNSHPGQLYRPKQGEMCLSKFSVDGMWYRAASVLPGLESSVVLFVDYGNSEDVPHSNIRQISSTFLELPCLAIHCIMSGIALDGMKEGASERLVQLLPSNSSKMLSVLQYNDDGTYTIDIPDIKEILLSEGLVMPK
ncbi:hypothetical protein Pcinc_008937 [Petrolisthes cinctipes]|uniref:Tudor domain-containing protein 1 n=1 Tax=Petrolisthes cinctipes TaxID=88211 RepID=A0AAE1KWS3_PETCI|nr:hypothetical protein Pcinc_008937 [Petrolisthes cinctipes]